MFIALAAGLCGCGKRSGSAVNSSSGGELAASFRGGAITRAELEAEANRLTPALREEFATPAGHDALALSMVDAKLLVAEARRRSLDRDPDLRHQIDDLEQRLLIKALVASEQKAIGPAQDSELRAAYAANRDRYTLPERVRLGRVFVRAGTSNSGKGAARSKADRLRARLMKGESLASVEKEADGPERARGGELGVFAQADFQDPSVGRAAFALVKGGQVSPVLTTADGFVVLQLIERLATRVQPFDEVRSQVAAQLAAGRQRAAFDALRKRLREAADVHLEPGAAR